MSRRTSKQRRAAARRRAWCAAWRRLVDDRGMLRDDGTNQWIFAGAGLAWAWAGRHHRRPAALPADADDLQQHGAAAVALARRDTRFAADNRPRRDGSRRRGDWPFTRGSEW